MCDLFLSLINKYTLNQNYMSEQNLHLFKRKFELNRLQQLVCIDLLNCLMIPTQLWQLQVVHNSQKYHFIKEG
jgi:hypothetical protein